MTPHAHTSTAGLLLFYFAVNTSGAMYFKVPASKSGLN
jgi:hypothetical protein